MKTGDILPALEIAGVSRTTLALYAGASGDHNPMHIDLDVARSAGMGDVFAHGMLSMAYLGRLLTNYVPQERIRTYSVRFASITPLHAKLTCSGTVTKVEDGMAHLDLTVALADGTVTLRGDAVVAA
ncbi:dehydratase [Rhodococcus erythropolis]|uniref:MaoC/PaaZ C-terminal domain-containing protein n=1 Tax=Rhodococcus erythropolis TaxID=1833 RepID=UPI00061B77C7|nr:MaoC/PaaZ C-terminal domain-containing protein [Rhodococcus erythropolis]AKE00083.1 dehydratase [Rhodococcus erythropolis]